MKLLQSTLTNNNINTNMEKAFILERIWYVTIYYKSDFILITKIEIKKPKRARPFYLFPTLHKILDCLKRIENT